MNRQRVTRDAWDVRGDYGHGHGYETVMAETSLAEARARLREYRENEPGVAFKLVKTRQRLTRAELDTRIALCCNLATGDALRRRRTRIEAAIVKGGAS